MEIIIGIVAVVVVLFVIGKLKGAPDPSAMSEAAIAQRIHTETAWISKYQSQPLSSQQSPSLQRMYDEKIEYVKNLKTELIKRQLAQGGQAVQEELAPILQRAADLVKDGKSEPESNAMAIKEWSEKAK